MKLKYTDGCICTSLTVDDIETIDLDIVTFKNVIKKFLTFGRDKSFTVLLECIHQLIKETYYEKYEEIEENVNVPDNANYYMCVVNNRQYEYTEWFNKDTVYDIISINKEVWDNTFTKEMHDDMCKLIDNIEDVAVLQSIFCSVLEKCGKYDCSNRPCDCCGDYIRTYTMEIN